MGRFGEYSVCCCYLLTLTILFAEGGNNSTVVLYFNTECNLYVAPFKAKRSQRVIVMHNPGRDSRWLVDGNSVLKLLNDADYTEMTYFIDQAKRRGALTACSSSY